MTKLQNILEQYSQRIVNNSDLNVLVDNSLLKIRLLNNKKLQLVSFGWYLSSLCAGFSAIWLLSDLKSSGALLMIKILISRFSDVSSNWQDYMLSLSDLMPIYSLVTVILSLAMFVVINKEKKRFSPFNFNLL